MIPRKLYDFLAASLQAQGDSFLLCLFVAVVIMCEGAALLWGPRWLKWTITVIAAFITLAMLGVCIAYGQTVKPAMPNTHPLVNCRLPDGSVIFSWTTFDAPPLAPTRDCTKAEIDEAGPMPTVKSLQGVLTPAQQAHPQAVRRCEAMKKLRNAIKHKFSTRRFLKWFQFKHRPCKPSGGKTK